MTTKRQSAVAADAVVTPAVQMDTRPQHSKAVKPTTAGDGADQIHDSRPGADVATDSEPKQDASVSEAVTEDESTSVVPNGDKWLRGFGPDSPLAEVAIGALQSRLERVVAILPLAASSAMTNPEYVHQLRVSCRRTHAVLEVFGDLIRDKNRLKLEKTVREIRQGRKEARDCDVLRARLAPMAALPPADHFINMLWVQRLAAQRDVEKSQKKWGKSGKLAQSLVKTLAHIKDKHSDSKSGRVSFRQFAGKRIRPILRDFFAAAEQDVTDITALHALRIEGKQLRYAVELLASAFPARMTKQVYPKLARLQDRLGAINDHATAQSLVQEWIASSPATIDRSFLEDLLQNEQIEMERLRREFLAWWTPAHRKELKRGFSRCLK